MNKISFTSNICPVPSEVFDRVTSKMDATKFVAPPWTYKESVKSNEAYTKGIIDCTVCGITDGKEVYMMHICPERKENRSFSKIEKSIKTNVDIKSPNLKALLIGSQDYYDLSPKLFNNFVNFFKKHNIPCTELRGGQMQHKVAYRGSTDTWLISNYFTDKIMKGAQSDPEHAINVSFDDIKLSKFDRIF